MNKHIPHYSIDTSALIDWWEVYSPDVFPGLLPLMTGLVAEGQLHAVRYVRDEIRDSEDDNTLAKWCRSQDGFYFDDDEPIQRHVRAIMGRFQVPKKTKGISGADPFVIACAARNGPDWHVVSSERPATGNAHRNPNIPFVCASLKVNHIRFLDMLRMEGWRLG